VRHAAVTPLRVEKMLDLTERAVRIKMGEADRDERRIPAPLMWIEARRGLRPPADVVPRQDGDRLVA
jgi:hypothetical protein